MKNKNLASCPFCDGETPPVFTNKGDGFCRVLCSWCSAEGPTRESRSKAVEAWNERNAEQSKIDHLKEIEGDYNALVDQLRSMHYTLQYEGDEPVIECDACTEPLGCGHLDGCEYGEKP